MKKKELKKELKECEKYLKEGDKRETENLIARTHLFKECERRAVLIKHMAKTIQVFTERPWKLNGED